MKHYFRIIGVLLLLGVFSVATAHNKVVVIPMAGDPLPLVPFAPLAPENPAASNYTATADTVVDKTTGLMWQRSYGSGNVDNVPRTFDVAWNYCRDLPLAGFDDWRLPDRHELQSIVSYGQSSPAINGAVFTATFSSYYWSASSVAGSTSSAWLVYFGSGHVDSGSTGLNLYVRCVR